MKATLKHASGQYVLIADERPKLGEYYYRTQINIRKCIDDSEYDDNDFKIIAAENLKGVKGIMIHSDLVSDGEGEPLLFPINDPNHYIEPDTEVEVTEEEDYWVVGL